MQYSLHSKSDNSLATIIATYEETISNKKLLGKTKATMLELHRKKKNFRGKDDESVFTHITQANNLQKILLFGLGKEKDMDNKSAREKAATLIKLAKQWEEKDINLIIPKTLQNHLQAFGEGLSMGNYDPAIYKTGDDQKKLKKKQIKKIHIIATEWTKDQEQELEKGITIAEVINYTRNIVNCDPEKLSTETFVKEIKQVAKENHYKIKDLNKKQLKKLGMEGILAVNRGSKEPAHMLILEHNAKQKENPIVIAGKGIIFDTGGISLKPASHLNEMQLDMGGAAVVLGVFKLLKKLKIKRRIIGVIPITDNAIGNNAYKPSEIITSYSGKTVEIMNTDAEGRMILCDALAYSEEKFSPRYMVDFATLTGACMVALGFRTAGLFVNNDELASLLIKAGEKTDEAICNIPINDADEKAMKGKLADLTNLATDHNYAGASRAAAFLKNFVGKTKWAHVDIAGPSFTKNPKPYESMMGTGFGIRLMIEFLESLED